jgi:hypothetical protein
MNSWARPIAAGTLMIVLAGFAAAGCGQASPTTPAPTVTVTVTPTQAPSGAGGGIGQSSTPAVTPSSTPTTPAAPTSEVGVCVTPVVTCRGELKSEPSQIIVSGDGSAFISGLTWIGWGLPGATGSGTLKLDNCNPNCAQGSFTDYVATVVLSDLTGYVGGAAYATMEVDAAGSPFGTKTYHHLAP